MMASGEPCSGLLTTIRTPSKMRASLIRFASAGWCYNQSAAEPPIRIIRLTT